MMKNILFVAAFIFPMLTMAKGNMETVEFKVNGNCGGCKANIENAAKIEGVSEAEWSVETKMLSLTYCTETVDLDDVYQKIADAGYTSEKLEATGSSSCGSKEAESGCGSGTSSSGCCSGGNN